MNDVKDGSLREWMAGVLAWLTVYRYGTYVVAGTTIGGVALLGYAASIRVDISSALENYPGLYLLAIACTLGGLGFGIWLGISFHRGFSSRRVAPLGYRIDKLEHWYEVEVENPSIHRRRRTEHIVAKRDQVSLLLGRYRPSMSSVPRVTSASQGVNVAAVGQLDFASDWHYYIAHWKVGLERGQKKSVAVSLEINDHDRTAKPHYRTTITSYVGELDVRMRLPEVLVQPGSVTCYATRLENGDARGARIIPYEYLDGEIHMTQRYPRLGWVYIVSWEWRGYAADPIES